jgi:hypothetical protein
MKIALVYHHNGRQVMQDQDGEVAFPTFRWRVFDRSETGWTLHLAASCVATTEDFKFQMFQGLIALGWHGGPLIEFAPNIDVHRFHLDLKGAFYALHRRLL